MRHFAFLCTLLTITVTLCHDEDDDADDHIVQYNYETFAEEVPKKNHFVMFYVAWCGDCQRLDPTWEQLAEILNEEDGSVRIAKVDCTVDIKLCSQQNVTGYPTMKFFKVGESEGVKFKGTRDLPTFTEFINDQLGSDFDDQWAKPDAVMELTEDNFEKTVSEGKHLVTFYVSWCDHCEKFTPVLEQLAEAMKGDTSANIAEIDCTQYRTICDQFEVNGYPTLLWIEDGKKVDKYQGHRTLEDLKKYIKFMNEPVLMLTGDNFEETVQYGITVVDFFAPWCGHCQTLSPTFEALAKKFKGNGNVHVAKVDCTLEPNNDLCSRHDLKGYPSIFFYKDGVKMSKYDGDRSVDDLFDSLQSL